MKMEITFKKEGDAECMMASSAVSGKCWITISEGNREMIAMVDIAELQAACRMMD